MFMSVFNCIVVFFFEKNTIRGLRALVHGIARYRISKYLYRLGNTMRRVIINIGYYDIVSRLS